MKTTTNTLTALTLAVGIGMLPAAALARVSLDYIDSLRAKAELQQFEQEPRLEADATTEPTVKEDGRDS